MAHEGIISDSHWCAPAVSVPKSNRELHICLVYLIKLCHQKDSNLVPRAKGPQLKLAGKHVFSQLGLCNAYWSFPTDSHSVEKSAFCQEIHSKYGLTGATQTCQQSLDTSYKSCVYNYVYDCIVYSDDLQSHITDLHKVLGQLMEAGFTLRGSKCAFGMITITHLEFQYSLQDVTPSSERTQAVASWPPPKSTKELRSFLN